jgi:hypothetical protein
MIQLPDNLDVEDVHQWVGRGVFLAELENELRPCVLCEHRSGGNLEVSPLLPSGRLGRPSVVPRRKVYAAWPECGAVNLRDTETGHMFAAYVERLQRRQYSRTVNSRCLSLYVPERWSLYKRSGCSVRTGDGAVDQYKIAQLFAQRPYPTVREAMELLPERGSVAITNKLIVAIDIAGRPRLYYRTANVGSFAGGEFVPDRCKTVIADRVRRLLEKVE